jgi:uncharacterized protein (DUF58 family)
VSAKPAPLLTPDDLRRISDLGLIARWIVEGTITGLHRSPYHGFSIEFAEYREYAPGDDLRYFDWKVFGRSDRRTIKKFHSETNLHGLIVLDASRSMGYGDPSKLHYGRCLAAALAHVLQAQQDAFGLVLLGDGVRARLPSSLGPSHLRHVHHLLERVEPSGGTRMAPALEEIAETMRRRGLIAIISDLHDDEAEMLRAIRHFRFEGHEVIVFHILDPTELRLELDGPLELEDLESGERIEVHAATVREEYRRRVEAWIAELRAGCEGCRADYRLVETTEPFAGALSDYLAKRRLWRAST